MLKSVLDYQKIVLEPYEVRRDWSTLNEKLKQVSQATLAAKGFRLTNDPTFEFFLRNVFDDTGAISIKKTDFIVRIPELKRFYEHQWNSYSVRMVENSTHYFLRGGMYYLAHLDIDAGLFLVKALEEIAETEKLLAKLNGTNFGGDYVSFALALGLLDNRKNHVIEVLSALNQVKRLSGDPILSKTAYEGVLTYVQSTVDDFYTLLLTKELECNATHTITTIQEETDYLLAGILANKSLVAEHRDNIFRKYREASNPYLNGLLAKSIHDQVVEYGFIDTLLGIEYGGIELPFVVNSFLKLGGRKQLPIFLTKYGHYSQKDQRIESTQLPYQNLAELKNKHVLVLEDNTLTGQTIEKVVNDLKRVGAKSAYLGLIGYADAKRYHQMIMPNHGLINPDILLEAATIVTRSPFTRIYSSKSYTNKNGVFNKVEHKVAKSLEDNYPEMRMRA